MTFKSSVWPHCLCCAKILLPLYLIYVVVIIKQVLLPSSSLPKTLEQTTPTNEAKGMFADEDKVPVILLWVPPYHYPRRWTLPETDLCGGGCTITVNRSRINESSALVFYMKGTRAKDIPKGERNTNQIYVWWCHESPWTVNFVYDKTLDAFPNFFNLTMHYRSDSDVIASPMPHSARDWYLHQVGRSNEASKPNLHPHTSEEEFDEMFEKLYMMKTKTAAWLISDCDITRGASKRLSFGKSIMNDGNFSVDIFGKCGTREIPPSNKAAFELIQNYKFYFAFENTLHCKEFITSHFWYNSLYAAAVPIAWGTDRRHYERLAPSGSFIHAEDFDNNPLKLAAYLREVDKNKELYKTYFKWWWTMPGFYPIFNFREPEEFANRVQDNIFDLEVMGFCHLCHMLRNRTYKSPSIVKNLRKSFFREENNNCYM